MNKQSVVFVTNFDVHENVINMLSERFQVIVNRTNTRREILEKVTGVDAILWAAKDSIDKEILDAAGPNLKMISLISTGFDYVDVEEVKKRNIKLTNTADVGSEAVANVGVLLTLAASRRLHEARLKIQNGEWSNEDHLQWLQGQDLEGSTVGIIGLGNIGYSIAKKLQVFGIAKCLYCGHREKPTGKEIGASFLPFDELIVQSDFIIITCPLTSETEEMFNESVFRKMKNTAILVNVSRGGIIDQKALINALKQGVIFAVGLDVTTPEPLPTNHELLKLPNCIITPHFASCTIKTRAQMTTLAAQNIIKFMNGEPLITPVLL